NGHRNNVYNIRASAEPISEEPPQAGGFMTAAIILVIVLGVGGFGWKYLRATPNTAIAAPVAPKPAPVAQPIQQPLAQPTATAPISDAAAANTATPDKANPIPDNSSAAE